MIEAPPGATNAIADQRRSAPPQSITPEMLEAALRVLRLEFSPEQINPMLPPVNRGFGNLEGLRKIPAPLDTEPAFRFRPCLRGKSFRKTARLLPTRTAPRGGFKSLENLAMVR